MKDVEKWRVGVSDFTLVCSVISSVTMGDLLIFDAKYVVGPLVLAHSPGLLLRPRDPTAATDRRISSAPTSSVPFTFTPRLKLHHDADFHWLAAIFTCLHRAVQRCWLRSIGRNLLALASEREGKTRKVYSGNAASQHASPLVDAS